MSKPQTVDGARLLTGMAEIVSAYAARNKLTPRELVEAITHVAQALASVQHATIAPEVSTPLTPEELVTAIRLGRIDGSKPRPLTRAEIAASIQDKYLISFENGLPYSMLRRHLTTMGMTPDEYRAKWGLPEDYPVVALHLTRRRHVHAKSMTLGSHERLPRAPRSDKRKFRLEGGVWITNTPTGAASRDQGADDPERQIPVPLGTGLMVTPEVAALAIAPQKETPAPLGTGVMTTPEGVVVATIPV